MTGNKYLLKIAEKVELEPGVFYDTSAHEIKPSRTYISDQLGRKEHRHRLVAGLAPAIGIGLLGAGFGSTNHKSAQSGTGPSLLRSLASHRHSGKAFVGLGGALGAAAGLGLGYALGGPESYERKMHREDIQADLEKRHQAKIDELEGW